MGSQQVDALKYIWKHLVKNTTSTGLILRKMPHPESMAIWKGNSSSLVFDETENVAQQKKQVSSN